MIKIKTDKEFIVSILKKSDTNHSIWRVVSDESGMQFLPKEFFETEEGFQLLNEVEELGKTNLIFDEKDFK